MTKYSKQDRESSVENKSSMDGLMARFTNSFSGRWDKLDREYDEMDKEIKRVRELNGKATNHEIDL